jgi:hypothetical protein
VAEAAAQPDDSAGDPILPNCYVIEINVAELNQLFNAIDPTPFRQRDLDPHAEEFIVGWAREIPADAPLALIVHLDRPAGLPEEPAILRDAIREFFGQRAQASTQRLRQLFQRGRTSLAIGITFLVVSLLLGDVVARLLGERRVSEILRESLLIGGWVAMWRPLEVFLYDWWPIRADARLAERLSAMPVRISYKTNTNSDAWRSDWPAVPAPTKTLATAERRARVNERRPTGANGHYRTVLGYGRTDNIEGRFAASAALLFNVSIVAIGIIAVVTMVPKRAH